MPDTKYEGVLIATQDEHLPAITAGAITTTGSRLGAPPQALILDPCTLLRCVTTASTQRSPSYYRMLLHTSFEKPSESIILVHVHTAHISKLSFLTKRLKHLLTSRLLSLRMFRAWYFFFRGLKDRGGWIKLNFSRIFFHFGKCACLRR